MSNTDGCTGTTTLSACFRVCDKPLPCRPAGESITSQLRFGIDAARVVLAPIETNDARQVRRPHGEPGQGRLLPVQIPQQDLVLQTRERARQVGGYRGLPRTALRIDDQYRVHETKYQRINQLRRLAGPATESGSAGQPAHRCSQPGRSVAASRSGWSAASTKLPRSSSGGNSSSERSPRSSRKARVVAYKRRAPGHLTMPNHVDPAPRLERLEHAGRDRNAADILDVAASDRLTIGYDRQRLQHRPRVPAAVSAG